MQFAPRRQPVRVCSGAFFSPGTLGVRLCRRVLVISHKTYDFGHVDLWKLRSVDSCSTLRRRSCEVAVQLKQDSFIYWVSSSRNATDSTTVQPDGFPIRPGARQSLERAMMGGWLCAAGAGAGRQCVPAALISPRCAAVQLQR
jgi:hypothetical protein